VWRRFNTRLNSTTIFSVQPKIRSRKLGIRRPTNQAHGMRLCPRQYLQSASPVRDGVGCLTWPPALTSTAPATSVRAWILLTPRQAAPSPCSDCAAVAAACGGDCAGTLLLHLMTSRNSPDLYFRDIANLAPAPADTDLPANSFLNHSV
jgi:hypothetical protein